MSQSPTRPSSNVALTPKQANIFAWGWQDDARFRDAVCGRRFGKTFLGAKEMRRAAKLAAKWNVSTDDEIWYAAPTFKQAKRVFWRRLKKAIPPEWRETKPNETECSITLISGHVMRIVGLDSYDNLRGSGLFFVLVDEWADCPYEAWEEVLRPMLSTCKWSIDGKLFEGGHALRIGTPKGFNHCHDTYQIGQERKEQHRSWLYTSLQGGNVPKKEIDAARATMDARTFRQEYEGSFENYSGRVYYAFSRGESVKDCKYNPALHLHVGMDFNVNPMSATIFQEQPNGEIWQIDEIVIPTSNTDEMAVELSTRYGKASFEPGKFDLKHITIYPDPAGAQRRTSAQGKTDISILRSYGFNVLAMASHPLVRDRVNAVNSRFQSADGVRKLFVDPSCKQSIGCYEKLCYKDGTNDPDKDGGYDHLPDGTGYYVYGRFEYTKAHRTHINHASR
jgi:hypothetical protein